MTWILLFFFWFHGNLSFEDHFIPIFVTAESLSCWIFLPSWATVTHSSQQCRRQGQGFPACVSNRISHIAHCCHIEHSLCAWTSCLTLFRDFPCCHHLPTPQLFRILLLWCFLFYFLLFLQWNSLGQSQIWALPNFLRWASKLSLILYLKKKQKQKSCTSVSMSYLAKAKKAIETSQHSLNFNFFKCVK